MCDLLHTSFAHHSTPSCMAPSTIAFSLLLPTLLSLLLLATPCAWARIWLILLTVRLSLARRLRRLLRCRPSSHLQLPQLPTPSLHPLPCADLPSPSHLRPTSFSLYLRFLHLSILFFFTFDMPPISTVPCPFLADMACHYESLLCVGPSPHVPFLLLLGSLSEVQELYL